MTGESFYTIGYAVTASFNGMMATSVVVDSETQATATFDGGVPISTVTDQSRDDRANLFFQLDNSPVKFKSINSKEEVKTFVNPFTLASSTSGLECSFNGGCDLTMTGSAGVQTMMRADPKNNYIKVCEQKCEFDDAASTATDI